jgi:hypothetical protein
MSKWLFIPALFFLACLVPACSYTQEPVDKFTWDFGDLKEGQVVRHDFIIKNETSSELRIKEVTTSCGCTLSKIRKLVIKPGESAMVEVEFNSKGYSGKVKQHVYVNYTQADNLDNLVLRYIITANVLK